MVKGRGKQDGQVGGRTLWESNLKEILVERAITGVGRNLVIKKLPGIHKDGQS